MLTEEPNLVGTGSGVRSGAVLGVVGRVRRAFALERLRREAWARH